MEKSIQVPPTNDKGQSSYQPKGEQMTANQRYKQALTTCLQAGMTPDAAKRMALAITRRTQKK